MMGVGIFIGCIGLDPMTSGPRFTFGLSDLYDGVGLAPVIMGLFGISEVLENVGVVVKSEIFGGKIKGLFPNREDWKRSALPITRGTLLGFFLGILPGWETLSLNLSVMLLKRSYLVIPRSLAQA
jgi:putative tricarboxylic transport membrane protein